MEAIVCPVDNGRKFFGKVFLYESVIVKFAEVMGYGGGGGLCGFASGHYWVECKKRGIW